MTSFMNTVQGKIIAQAKKHDDGQCWRGPANRTQKQVVITQEIVERLSKQPEWEKELEQKCGAHLPPCHA